MSQYNDDEQKAWDLFFSAALPLAKAEGLATSSNVDGSWAGGVCQSGGTGGRMLWVWLGVWALWC
uniref:hypothetical protein n=1 Tax=Pseudomonas izuensis TaxID=2684212 RepID=UPI001C49BEFE